MELAPAGLLDVVGGVALAVCGGLAWWLLARRQRRATPLAAVAAWADACCPACLSLAAVEARR